MSTRELLILTGMSGAGRSTVAHALEDLSWYVVDNLPPSLLPDLASQTSGSEFQSVAVVVDVRGGKFFDHLNASLAILKQRQIPYRLLFLDASDQILVARFESTRRPHPLQGAERIVDGISRERAKLDELRGSADIVIDSSNLNVHQLEKRVAEIFSPGSLSAIRINVLSFGFKYGIPVDADLLLDARFIPNPHWVPELRPLTGLNDEVFKAVIASDGIEEFIRSYVVVLLQMIPGYLREGKRFVTLAIGCTGGKHRSVSIAREIARQLSSHSSELEISAHATHRDVGRE
jgi:RNase adapter protein RapZ